PKRIVRFEHELLARISNEGHQVQGSAVMASRALRDDARPRDVRINGLALVTREQSHILLVTQYCQARLLVEQLAAKGIHHTHRTGLDRANHRMIAPAPFHELAEQQALVDQVDRLSTLHATTPLEFR